MGHQNDLRLQLGFSLNPKAGSSTKRACNELGKGTSHDAGGKRPCLKMCDSTSSTAQPRFLQSGVPKSDGSWRPVINLKELNRYVVHHHFKTEGIRMLQGLIQEVDWLVKLDLKDAYLTVPITSNHQKFLCFWWDRQPWEFSSLPFGFSSARMYSRNS